MVNNSYKYFINLCTVCPDREKYYMISQFIYINIYNNTTIYGIIL